MRRSWTNGAFARALGPVLLATALAPCAALAAEPLPVTRVAPGVYVHRGAHGEATAENLGAIANVGFIVGGEAVAVIDTGGSAAEGRRLRAAVRQVTDLPIRYVINTHVHPDHVFGNAAFLPDGPIFVGHSKLPRALAARGAYYLAGLKESFGDLAEATEVVPPSLTVTQLLTLDLGGRILRLTAYPTGHTDNDLTVLDVESGTLLAGDLLFMERVPVVDGSLKGWLEVIAELRQVEAKRVVPGHGPISAPWPAALDGQERYLRALLEGVRTVIRDGGTMEQAVESVGRDERPAWRLFDDYHARNVVTAFAELEWE